MSFRTIGHIKLISFDDVYKDGDVKNQSLLNLVKEFFSNPRVKSSLLKKYTKWWCCESDKNSVDYSVENLFFSSKSIHDGYFFFENDRIIGYWYFTKWGNKSSFTYSFADDSIKETTIVDIIKSIICEYFEKNKDVDVITWGGRFSEVQRANIGNLLKFNYCFPFYDVNEDLFEAISEEQYKNIDSEVKKMLIIHEDGLNNNEKQNKKVEIAKKIASNIKYFSHNKKAFRVLSNYSYIRRDSFLLAFGNYYSNSINEFKANDNNHCTQKRFLSTEHYYLNDFDFSSNFNYKKIGKTTHYFIKTNNITNKEKEIIKINTKDLYLNEKCNSKSENVECELHCYNIILDEGNKQLIAKYIETKLASMSPTELTRILGNKSTLDKTYKVFIIFNVKNNSLDILLNDKKNNKVYIFDICEKFEQKIFNKSYLQISRPISSFLNTIYSNNISIIYSNDRTGAGASSALNEIVLYEQERLSSNKNNIVEYSNVKYVDNNQLYSEVSKLNRRILRSLKHKKKTESLFNKLNMTKKIAFSLTATITTLLTSAVALFMGIAPDPQKNADIQNYIPIFVLGGIVTILFIFISLFSAEKRWTSFYYKNLNKKKFFDNKLNTNNTKSKNLLIIDEVNSSNINSLLEFFENKSIYRNCLFNICVLVNDRVDSFGVSKKITNKLEELKVEYSLAIDIYSRQFSMDYKDISRVYKDYLFEKIIISNVKWTWASWMNISELTQEKMNLAECFRSNNSNVVMNKEGKFSYNIDHLDSYIKDCFHIIEIFSKSENSFGNLNEFFSVMQSEIDSLVSQKYHSTNEIDSMQFNIHDEDSLKELFKTRKVQIDLRSLILKVCIRFISPNLYRDIFEMQKQLPEIKKSTKDKKERFVLLDEIPEEWRDSAKKEYEEKKTLLEYIGLADMINYYKYILSKINETKEVLKWDDEYLTKETMYKVEKKPNWEFDGEYKRENAK